MSKWAVRLGLAVAVGGLAGAPARAGLSPISFGIKGGATLGVSSAKDSSGSSTESFGSGMGFLGGPSLDIGAGPIGVMLDVLYAMRKSKVTVSAGGLSASASTSYNQLFVPLLLRLSLGFLRLEAGGYYASNLGKVKIATTLNGSTDTATSSWSDLGYKSSSYGATAGLGLSVSRLSAEVRYNLGLSNDLSAPSGSASSKFNSVDILLGLSF